MAEIAQPMHAFDWDLLHGPTILVRQARAGEHIVALNEEEYRLDPRDLVRRKKKRRAEEAAQAQAQAQAQAAPPAPAPAEVKEEK